MFGAPKVAGGLSITRILQIASALNNSLPSIFDQLITLIESSEKKLQLAKRYQRHRIVIDVSYHVIHFMGFILITISFRC